MSAHPAALRRLATAAALALAACTDAPEPTTPQPPAAPAAGETARVRCTVDVAASAMSCEDDAGSPAASATLIVGGQGRYVRLASTNVVRQADTLRADVTVQNLTDQAMGTPDGTTATGLRVFFHQGPTVTGGSGAVTVENADGVGTFTASGQPYFDYPELLPPVATSAPRTWRFRVDAGVTSFSFVVYVAADLPAEQSVLRWEQERGPIALSNFTRIWGTSDDNVFAVGTGGFLMHYDGTAWRLMDGPGLREVEVDSTGSGSSLSGYLMDVDGSSAHNVLAVGSFGPAVGAVLRYDGRAWTRDSIPPAPRLRGVWAESDTLAFAVGRDGAVLRKDHDSWSVVPVPTSAHLYAVWGFGADDVYVVGAGGLAMRFDGSTWSALDVGTTAALWGVRGTPSGDLYVASDSGVVLRRAAGDTAWTHEAAAPGTPLYRFGVDTSGAPLVVGEAGTLLRRSPAGWTAVPTSTTQPLYGVWVSPSDRLFVAALGQVLHGSTSGITSAEIEYPYTAGCLRSVWAASRNAVFAVGDSGQILFDDGGGWDELESGTDRHLNHVWGFAADDVWAVGDSATTLHYDGHAWTAVDAAGMGDVVTAWGRSPDTLFVSDGKDLYVRRGASWEPMRVGDLVPATLQPSGDGTGGAVGLSFYGNGSVASLTRHVQWLDPANGLTTTGAVLPNGAHVIWAGSREPEELFIGYTSGTVEHRVDGRIDSYDLGSGAFDGINAVWGSGASDVYAATRHGALWHFNDSGWQPVWKSSDQNTNALRAVWGLDAHDVWAVGCYGTILHGSR